MFKGRLQVQRSFVMFKGGLLCSKGKYRAIPVFWLMHAFCDHWHFLCSNDVFQVQRDIFTFKGKFLRSKGNYNISMCFNSCMPFVGKVGHSAKTLAECQIPGTLPKMHFAKSFSNKTPAWVRWFEKPSQLWAKVCLCKMIRNNFKEMNSVFNNSERYSGRIERIFWNRLKTFENSLRYLCSKDVS